jgi:regulator of protease activity HflC (stomatin/prohibitin superfamily)
MNKFARVFLIALVAMFAAACGERVEVPPAHVGKILGKNGFQPETIPPSKFRLPACLAYCDALVTLETSDIPFTEKMQVFIPSDRLNVNLELRGTLAIRTDTTVTDPIFDRIVAGEDRHITVEEVYNTYVQQVTRGTVRNVTTEHDIAWIIDNRDAFALELFAAIREKLTSTGAPIEVARLELSNFQPPPVIVKAQEQAKTREIAIQQAEADARVAMVEADRALEVAQKTRLVDREKALAIAEQNDIAAKSVTAELLAYRRLEVIEALAESGNTIFFPVNMTDGQFEGAFTAELVRRGGE